jgi:DNA-binding transcriptional ArsR family regulator
MCNRSRPRSSATACGEAMIDCTHATVCRSGRRAVRLPGVSVWYPTPMSGTRGSILPDERRRLIAQRLRQHGSVAVSALEAEFGISPMTARRDLDELERRGMAQRTHGGAVLPGLSSHEDSFLQRLEVEVAAKERLAEAALGLLEPGEAVFVDSSTTA